jgi:GMP synthase-like glutamine amidotransferase
MIAGEAYLSRMKIHVLQHTQLSTPGTVTDWLNERGLTAKTTRFFEGDSLPDVEDVDFLIILGGGMGVHDEQDYPWLIQEKMFIRHCLDEHKTIFGICLGAQLIAHVKGATVKKHEHWEVGWHPIEIEGHGTITCFQYHQDTFEIPEGAKKFATNVITSNQGYMIGENVVAVQFHPEVDESKVDVYSNDCSATGPYVQSREFMMNGIRHIPGQKAWMFSLLDKLASRFRN